MAIMIGLVGIGFVANIAIGVYACVFSRIVFDHYVRKHYPAVYERLTQDPEFASMLFDQSSEMRLFRTSSRELSEDERLEFLRRRSKQLYWWTFGLWLSSGGAIVVACILCALGVVK